MTKQDRMKLFGKFIYGKIDGEQLQDECDKNGLAFIFAATRTLTCHTWLRLCPGCIPVCLALATR